MCMYNDGLLGYEWYGNPPQDQGFLVDLQDQVFQEGPEGQLAQFYLVDPQLLPHPKEKRGI